MGRAQSCNIDDLPLAFDVLHHQVEIVRSRRTLLVEGAPAESGIALHEAEARREVGYRLLERGPRRDRIEDRAGVGALGLHPRDGRRIERFHIAVLVNDLAAPERFGDRFDGCRLRFGGKSDRGGGVHGRRVGKRRKNERRGGRADDESGLQVHVSAFLDIGPHNIAFRRVPMHFKFALLLAARSEASRRPNDRLLVRFHQSGTDKPPKYPRLGPNCGAPTPTPVPSRISYFSSKTLMTSKRAVTPSMPPTSN